MDVCDAVLKGDFSHLPQKQSNTVRIFLSSTFGDFITERNELMRHTFPVLRDYCQSKNLEFQVVDMRWGVRDENISYHQTSDICIQEIHNCQRLSLGPSFIALLGNRYGYRPFPAKIPETEFSLFHELAAAHKIDTSILSTWFKCDHNAVPPVYQLQPITVHYPHYTSKDPQLRERDRAGWWETFLQLQGLFWQLVDVALKEGMMTQQRAHVYLQSVTEDEVHSGVSLLPAPNDHCLCYIRDIVDLQDNMTEAIQCRYVDGDPRNPNQVDQNAQDLLQKLKEEKLPSSLCQSNHHTYSIPWSSQGVDPDVSKHKEYLYNLCEQVCSDVKMLVDKALVARQSRTTDFELDILHHASFCVTKCESFCGRENILKQISQFLTSDKQKPLIIYGHSGSGKTTIMAKSVRMVREWLGDSCISVVRFLGTSPASSSIRKTLISICSQVFMVLELQAPNFSEMNTTQIVQFFCSQFLECIQQHLSDRQLCIFLDSIDQLSPSDGAHSLNWLPKHLPPNVHIIVSMLPDLHGCLQTIRTMLTSDDCYIEVGLLPVQIGLDIMDVWLAAKNRTISKPQRELISKAFTLNPQPLYLRLLYHHTQLWCSYTDINDTAVNTSTSEALQQFFSSLEEQYGHILVQRALSYITAAKSGLTESELEDVLSLDNDVLNEVYQYWDPPDKGLLRLPALLWKRIRYDISDYLVEQHADGKTVFAWYHRQFVESARAIYLKDESTQLSIHEALCEFFEGKWSGKECKAITLVHRDLTLDNASRQVACQPIQFSKEVYNIRKLNELPYHLCLSKQLDKLKSIALCNFNWLHTKLTVTSFQSVVEDFQASHNDTTDSDLAIAGEALSLSASNLMADPDSLAGQLLGRLHMLRTHSPHISSLTEQASHWAVSLSTKHQLVPQNDCLISPGGPLKTTLSAHPNLIQRVAANDLFMVSSSKGDSCSSFNVWDVQHLPQYVRNLHTLKIANPGTPNFTLVQSPNLVIGSSGMTITAWNCITGETVFTVQVSHVVSALAVTPSNQYVLAGMVDGSVLCYDQLSGSSVESSAHDDGIVCLGAFKDGRVVMVSKSGQLGLYDTNTHKQTCKLQAHSAAITCLTTMSESYTLTGSEDKTARVWSIDVGIKLLHTLVGHSKAVKCLAHIQTNVAITGSLDKTIRIWAPLTGECLQKLEGHLDGVWCLAVLPNQCQFVSGSKDDYLKVWDVSTGDCLHTLEGHSSWVSCVTASSKDDVVISGSNDKNIKIWKFGGVSVPPTDRHFAQPECILATSKVVVSGAADAIKLWDIESASCAHTFTSPASCLCTTDNGQHLVSGSKEAKINIWSLNTLSLTHSISTQFGATTCLVMLSKQTYVSGHADGTLVLRSLDKEEYSVMTGHSKGIKCMYASMDKAMLVSGSHDCTVRVWNASSAECVAVLTGHSAVVWCVAISSDNRLVASGGDDSNLKLWSISEGTCLHSIPHPANVKCLVFSLDDRLVITGAHHGLDQLRGWDVGTGDCVADYKGHTHAVMCLQAVDGHTIISGSRDGTIRLWDMVTGATLATFDLQSQVKYVAIATTAKGQLSIAATTKSGPIAMFSYHRH